MDTIKIMITRGFQPYLYHCTLIVPQELPILLTGTCGDGVMLDRLIEKIMFLWDCRNIAYLTDCEFAEHLFYITHKKEHCITMKVYDVKEYLRIAGLDKEL